MPDTWGTAEICLNGHVISKEVTTTREASPEYCRVCGKPTIRRCPSCEAPIRGQLHSHTPGVFVSSSYWVPKFCHACGAPYPWTAAAIQAAKELAHDTENLSEEERAQLAGTIDDLVSTGPRTELAATRFKRLMGKAGRVAADGFRSLLVDVLSEAVKKAIWP